MSMRKEFILTALLLIAIIALLAFSKSNNSKTVEDARAFFEEDLRINYPDADARKIIDILKVGDGESEYYVLKAAVSYDLLTPCPERIEVQYYYPTRNFVRQEDRVVSNCYVCLDNNCLLSYPEQAIIASHIHKDSEQIKDYLSVFPQATPNAVLLPSYQEQTNVWKVVWSDPSSDYSLEVYISQKDNEILKIDRIAE
jgi:hypothetical protein